MKNSTKRSLGLLGTFALVFAVHVVASFSAWAFAPGNVVPHSQKGYGLVQPIAWPIFSFPTFYLAPGRAATTSFEALLVVNSLIVAAVVIAIALACLSL